MTPDLILKSSLLIVLAGAVAWALRGQSASWRNLVWRASYLALVLLPLSSVLLVWQLHVLPRIEERPVAASEPAIATPAPTASCCAIEPADLPTPAVTEPMDFGVLLLCAWGVGLFMVLSRFCFGLAKLRMLTRQSEPVLGVVRRATTDEPRCAIALGFFRPIVLLPRVSHDWPSSRRRIVVLHELAHVRRRDFVSNVVGELACALYWFNPLVWLGARAMRAEAESAADNEVLASGVRATDYASELLVMSTDLASIPRRIALVGASPMVQPKIEARLARILAPSLRRQGVTTIPTLLVLGAALLVSAAIAGVRIAERTPAARPLAESKVALERMRFLGTATTMYSMDYDEVLPSAASTEIARQIVNPYLKSHTSFMSPTSGGRIVYNTSLSGRKLKSFGYPIQVPTWIEILPNPAEPFGVTFVDGHGELVVPTDLTASPADSAKIVRVGNAKSERWELKRGAKTVVVFANRGALDYRSRSMDVTGESLATARSLTEYAKPVYGTSVSQIKVVAFFDYECPACRQADLQVQKAIQSAGNVALYYREFPMPRQHPLSVPASILSAKARLKGPFAYAAVHADLLQGAKLDNERIKSVQRKYGFDLTVSAPVQKMLDEDARFASDLKLTFVPSYVVIENNQVTIMNSYALLKRLR